METKDLEGEGVAMFACGIDLEVWFLISLTG